MCVQDRDPDDPTSETETQAPPRLTSSAAWEGVFMYGAGWIGARITAASLDDDERAEVRVEIDCDPEKEAGFHTREREQQDPGSTLLVRANGPEAIEVLGELLRAAAHRLDAVLGLASAPVAPGRIGASPLPPTGEPEMDLDEIRAALAAGVTASQGHR